MPGCCDWDPSPFGFDPKRYSDVVVRDDDGENRDVLWKTVWSRLEEEKAAAPLAARRMVARVASFVMVGDVRCSMFRRKQ
jgi:hypothetical protein